LLAGAPRENFGPIPGQTQIFVPLASGDFAQVRVAQSQLMEEPLAVQFPDLRTYVFASEGLTGQFVRGPHGTSFSAQSVGGIQHVEPVETRSGRVYVSYFDAKRTDGANVIEHDPHMAYDDTTPPPVPFAPQALQSLGAPIPVASAGTQLRIYRLAVSTTGEFYQGRDMGNGLTDVVASILADLAGANAILEPEVSVRLVLAPAPTALLY